MAKQPKWQPDAVFSGVVAIRAGWLRAQGVRGLVVDIDNTLTEHDSVRLDDAVRDWVVALRAAGIRMVLISNNGPARVAPFAEKLNLEWVANAHKPLRRGYARAQALLDIDKQHLAVVGDQLFTDVVGARRYGAKALLVAPVAPDLKPFIRFKRRLEAPLMRRIAQSGVPRYE